MKAYLGQGTAKVSTFSICLQSKYELHIIMIFFLVFKLTAYFWLIKPMLLFNTGRAVFRFSQGHRNLRK